VKNQHEMPDAGANQALSRLEAWEGVRRLTLRAGQVLIHAGHTPPGVFVFLSGQACVGATTLYNDGGGPPFLIPAPDALPHPIAESVVIERDATALFVPRSVVLREIAVRELLQIIEAAWRDPEDVGPKEKGKVEWIHNE